MSILLGNLGWRDANNKLSKRPETVVLQKGASAGCLILVAEFNDSGAFAQNSAYGDGSNTHRLKVFEVDDAGVVNLRYNANIATWATPHEVFSADLFSDDSIAITYRTTAGLLAYRKLTYGTWVMSTQETIYTPTGTQTVRWADVSVSQGGVPVVAYMVGDTSNPKSVCRLQVRGSTGGTWGTAQSISLQTTADPDWSMSSCSLVTLNAGSAAARPLLLAIDSAVDSGADAGCKLYSTVFDEAGGTLSAPTLQKTYLAGDQATKYNNLTRRTYLFNAGAAVAHLARMEATETKNLLVARLSWTGTTFTEQIAPQTYAVTNDIILRGKFAASAGLNAINFYYIKDYSGSLKLVNYIARIDATAGTVVFSGPYRFDNNEASPDRLYPQAGTGKNAFTSTKHRVLYFNQNSNDIWQARYVVTDLSIAPTAILPSGTVGSGTPDLGVRVRLGVDFPQSRIKLQFQFAKDTNFTLSVVTYTQSDDKFVKVENTTKTASYLYIGDTLPSVNALTSGTWYWRVRIVDEFGNTSPYSTTVSISMSHPPSAANMYPSGGVSVTDYNVLFDWDFVDTLATDSQSAYQIVVSKASDGTVLVDTGKVTTSATAATVSVGSGNTGILLNWAIRLWDTDDVPGAYASETFIVAAAPTVVIDSPTSGSTVTGGTPAVLFTPTVASGRRIVAYEVTVSQGSTVVVYSGRTSIDSVSGVQQSWRVPSILPNGSYSVSVTMYDETGMSGTSTATTFTISATAPADPTSQVISTTNYNVEGAGYTTVTWSDSARDVDWVSWIIERADDLLVGGTTTVAQSGAWKQITEVTVANISGYSYSDYYAPSGYGVRYRVRQKVSRSGNQAVSNGLTVNTVYPQSDGYWIILPTTTPTVFRMYNVTGDDFTEEYEETEYTIAGRGRKIDRGDYLGAKGTLAAQLRDSSAASARQKLVSLRTVRAYTDPVYLRNPFGDVLKVTIGNLGVTRVPGVGTSEFVDVSIPYSVVF